MTSAGKNELAGWKAVRVALHVFLAYASVPLFAVAAVDAEGSGDQVVSTETSPSGVEVDIVVPHKESKDSTADTVARSDYEAGKSRLQAGDFDRAIELLRAASTEAPQRMDIRLSLGKAYEAAGRLDEAIETYTDVARRAQPDSEEARIASLNERYAIATRYARSGALPTC